MTQELKIIKETNHELDELIDKILTWNINGHTEPVIFQPEMKKAIKKLFITILNGLLEHRETYDISYDNVRPVFTEAVPVSVIEAKIKELEK